MYTLCNYLSGKFKLMDYWENQLSTNSLFMIIKRIPTNKNWRMNKSENKEGSKEEAI